MRTGRREVWAVLLAAAIGTGARPASAESGDTSLVAISASMERLVQAVSPSVVQLTVTAYRPVDDSDAGAGDTVARMRVVGSGVVVDASGLIVTNAHVIDGAERIDVAMTDAGGHEVRRDASGRARVLAATVLGVAPEIDLALLQVDATGLPALPIADYRHVHQGEFVLAIGSPAGLRNSVSMGTVSAVARQVDSDGPLLYIQTDAAINPGNSGGPLVNMRGELIGLNTMIRSSGGGSDGLGFALPGALIALAVPQLRDYGHLHRAMTGIAVQTVTPVIETALGLATDSGLLVADVAPGSPADSAGVHVGDVITRISVATEAPLTVESMYLQMFTLRDGQQLDLELLRSGAAKTIRVTAVVPAHDCERLPSLIDSRDKLVPSLSIMATALDGEAARMIPTRIAGGVVVLARVDTRDPPAAELRAGDVIHAVNGEIVTTSTGLRASIDRVGHGLPVVLQVERAGRLSYVAFELP